MGLAAPYAEGSDEFEWVRRTFEGSDLPKHISWREFLKKGYFVVPPPAPGLSRPVAYRWFAEGRQKDTLDLQPLPGDYAGRFGEGLQTQSGKIEFVSSSLTHFDPDDPERPPMSRYRPSWEGPAQPELAARYPLQMVSPHPRFSHHTLEDGKDSWTSDVADHRVLVDGRYYWIARLNADDAAARGIHDGDLVRLFNDRGAVVCAARLTQRLPRGVLHSYESSAVYEPSGTPGSSTDLGGCVNLLTPGRPIAAKTHSMAPNSCLVEVEAWVTSESQTPQA
jgi:trimethylamine-N-oxide reductase (cytochrome c)